MTLWSRFHFWLLAILRRSRMEGEMDAELRFHIEAFAEDLVRNGVSREEALRRARIEFGGIERAKEECRDAWGVNFIESFIQDLRFGFRMLQKDPGFTAVAILTLALGIGANTAIFSVVNGVLLRPLPFENADRIMLIREHLPGFNLDLPFNAPDFQAFAERQRGFGTLAIYSNRYYELSSSGAPERIEGARTSATLFPLLGIEPILGRTFSAMEEKPGHAVAVLSYGFWERRYGADRNILGRTIELDRERYTVIGVMPEGFEFPLRGEHWNRGPAELWVPLAFTPAELQEWGMEYNHTVLGRLKQGITHGQAQEDAARVIAEVEKLYPPEFAVIAKGQHLGAKVVPYGQEIVGQVRTPLLVLLVAVGLVLLIACANLANLELARTSGRQREIAIRSALGAARRRLVQQMLSENLLLASIAGTGGLGVGYLGRNLLLAISPTELPRTQEIRIDGLVLFFSLTASLLTAVFFGLFPALHASRAYPNEGLKEAVRGATQGRARRRMRGALIVSQTALAVVLLTGAGLLLRSFQRLLETNPGFQPERAFAMTIPLPLRAYSRADQIRNFYQELLRRTATLPGVISVGASTDLPLEGNAGDAVVKVEGRELSGPLEAAHSWILGDYFAAMGITLKRGRMLTPDDRFGAPDVVIVSETAARTYFPGEDPLGKRLFFDGKWNMVVGVASDVKDSAIGKPAKLHNYSPYLAMPEGAFTDPAFDGLRALHLAVRSRTDPASLISVVRGTVASLDPEVPIAEVKTMNKEIQNSLAPQRFNLFLLGLFALLAVFLASIGVYGVLSQSVVERTQEFGVRMALGASSRDVLGMTVREGMRWTLMGAGIGLFAALGLTRLMASLLYGVSSHDPATVGVVAVVITAVALLACYAPARRATQVDPMTALKYE
jgi:predicted permease